MHSAGRAPMLKPARGAGVHLSRLATTSAIVTCFAVILNVGPFASQKTDHLLGSPTPPAARSIPIQERVGSGSSEWPAVELELKQHPSPSDVITTDALEPKRSVSNSSEPSRFEYTFSSVSAAVDVLDSAPQSFPANQANGSSRLKPAQQETADPMVQPDEDRVGKDLLKRATFVGVWAPGSCSARSLKQGALPTFINAEGARAGETFCAFKNTQPTETGWKVAAQCSNTRERWAANIRLIVENNRLIWTSNRGTQTYTRCATDLLIAATR